MIDINLSPEQELIKETARDFANTQLLPGVIERDENQIFPKDEIKKMGELGFMGMMVPEEWGGSGLDTISYIIALEEIAAVELATSTIMSVNNSLVCQVLLDWGTDAQKSKFLNPLASGLKLGAYSLSEPQSGSDASNMKTFAEKNFHCGYMVDSDDLEDILHFRKHTLVDYYRMNREAVPIIRKYLSIPFRGIIKFFLRQMSEPLSAIRRNDMKEIERFF